MGGGAFGVNAAARRFFGKPASAVTLYEAALLAGSLKAPSRLNSLADGKAASSDAAHLAAIAESSPAGPRLVMLLGNTLGAFDALGYARQLARLLRAGDHLLVDGEVFSGAGTLAGYDNPLNRQFAFGPLRGLGLVDPGDGVLRFETDEDQGRPGLYRLRKHVLPARDLALQVAFATFDPDGADLSTSQTGLVLGFNWY